MSFLAANQVSIGIFCTADSNSFPLTKGVVGQTDVLSHNLPVWGFNWARFVAQITVKKTSRKGPLSDKTDPRAVFLRAFGSPISAAILRISVLQ